jgi:glutaredoxin
MELPSSAWPTRRRSAGSTRELRGSRCESLAGEAAGLPAVVLYYADGCHLCERARATVAAASDELGFKLEEVDIGGDANLEARYREWLPVVEINGERAFVYYVDPDALRRRLVRQ